MSRRLWAIAMLLFALPLLATSGSFRGILVHGPSGQANWIYLLGRNGSVRRVEISRARVTYSKSVPKGERLQTPQQALREGAEVRVIAEQDEDGEWRASQVEILNVNAAGRDAPATSDERLPLDRS